MARSWSRSRVPSPIDPLQLKAPIVPSDWVASDMVDGSIYKGICVGQTNYSAWKNLKYCAPLKYWSRIYQPSVFCANVPHYHISIMSPSTILKERNVTSRLTKNEVGEDIPKPLREWNEFEKRKASLNSKAMNTLFCALDEKEFHRVSSCESANEIWHKLEVVYEGTNQVKESKISRYTRQ